MRRRRNETLMVDLRFLFRQVFDNLQPRNFLYFILPLQPRRVISGEIRFVLQAITVYHRVAFDELCYTYFLYTFLRFRLIASALTLLVLLFCNFNIF